jgi:hypothetical protein
MDTLLLSLALAAAVAALVLAFTLRNRLDALERSALAAQRFAEDARRQLDTMRGELAELKAAAEASPPPPPLPRTRSAGLDDLRQQLRAAHSEDADSDEEA